jgi:hypothetical protein
VKVAALVTFPARVAILIFFPFVAPVGTVASYRQPTWKLVLTPPMLAHIVCVRLTPAMVAIVHRSAGE